MNQKVKTANKTNSYTIPTFYNYYLDEIEKDTIYDIPYTVYKDILIDFFKYLRSSLLEDSKCVKLPNRLGTIQIIKKRPKHYDERSLRIDYQQTKKLNKKIFLTNEHSNYYKYRCHWNKKDILVKNKSKYQLVLSRANKRMLAQYIKNNIHDYEEII